VVAIKSSGATHTNWRLLDRSTNHPKKVELVVVALFFGGKKWLNEECLQKPSLTAMRF
jgi:hypothetical protein